MESLKDIVRTIELKNSFQINGPRVHYEDDITILNILEFIGTGEHKKFYDILCEWHAKRDSIMHDAINNIYPVEKLPLLYDYIISKNYAICFEKNDIVIKTNRIV